MKYQVMKAVISTKDILQKTGYLFEPKLDGFRALCYVNKEIKLFSRNGIDLTDSFFPTISFRKNIKAKSAVLDGELVAFDKSGNPDFNLLKTGSQAFYIIFDILEKDGKSLINLPLIERKKILEKTVIDGNYIQKNIFVFDGLRLWQELAKIKFEGVMAKEINGLYYPGKRDATWLKVKAFNTLDCVIVGYKSGRRNISSLALGLYFSDKKLHYIGNVGTGFNEADLQDLETKLSKLVTNINPTINTDVKDITWVKPKLVCEVKYQQITPYGNLRISVFLRLRFDKKPIECTLKSQV